MTTAEVLALVEQYGPGFITRHALSVPCPFCRAAAGDWCRTVRNRTSRRPGVGHKSTELHSAREGAGRVARRPGASR